jgi:ATP-dependent DNA helicase RecG
MIGNQGKIVLNHLQRAVSAEEKQGCSNTGVVGGFHSFLKGILSRLEQLEPSNEFEVLRSIAGQYSDWSPLQRRQALSHLRRFIEECNKAVEAETIQSLAPRESIPVKASFQPLKVPSERSQKPLDSPQIQKRIELDLTRQRTSSALHTEAAPSVVNSVTAKSGQTLQYLKGVGPERAKQLEQIGIHTVKDLLLYFPRRYEDRRLKRIGELKDGEMASVAGKVVASQISRGKTKVIKLSIEQEGRLVYGVWFNQTFIIKQFPVGTSVILTGKVRWHQRIPEIQATDVQKAGGEEYFDIIPVYSESGRLSSKVIRSLIKGVISQTNDYFLEIHQLEEGRKWPSRSQAYHEIHFPRSFQSLGQARERLVFEEVLFLQLAVARLRKGVQRENSPRLDKGKELVELFYKDLPFELTMAQKRVIQEIFRDMAGTIGMARLVQGDVGSGKTAVAMAALLQAVGSGYQGAMMAPTEILAIQHFQTLEAAFMRIGVQVVCLLGSQPKLEREKILSQISSGSAQVIVGTHALIQESVQFHSLGLAVTDEQHRFGVKQRTQLQTKGDNPHVLVLTATPIPRTLALTLYGDLQLSVLDELPKGRKPILTRKLTERGRSSLEKFMEEQIERGRQVYVVCPLVEESESLDLISATQRFEYLQQRYPKRRVALLHGRMKGVQKEEIMKGFQAGEVDILVSTTVVEVGVNVPNATIMVIEGAERFGLAQLHQLRGRVGRGGEQSYCILLSDVKNSKRLDILCETQDGFRIAEEDLRIRGAGELLGTRQHGVMELRLADLSRDGRLVEEAYQMTQKVLSHPEKYVELWNEVEKYFSLEKVGLH